MEYYHPPVWRQRIDNSGCLLKKLNFSDGFTRNGNELNNQNLKKADWDMPFPKSRDLVAWRVFDTNLSEQSSSKPGEVTNKKLENNKSHVEEVASSNQSTGNVKSRYPPLRRPKTPIEEDLLPVTKRFPLLTNSAPALRTSPLCKSVGKALPRQRNHCINYTNNQPSTSPANLQHAESPQGRHQKTAETPAQLKPTSLLQAKPYMELIVLRGKFTAEIGAKLFISIIEKKKNDTLPNSLIKTCELWYDERDRLLCSIKSATGTGTRFTDFMRFLTEMCIQLKRAHIQKRSEIIFPLLFVLIKCCQVCVGLPIKSLVEVKCLLFVLSSLGRDMEMEFPMQMKHLLTRVKFGFLASSATPDVRATLLQLIEMSACSWELPESSLQYYNA